MSSEGPNTGATVTNVDTGGNAWSNTGNMLADDDAYCSVEPSFFPSDILRVTNFGFSLPSSTIDGIEVSMKRYASTSVDVVDSLVQLVLSGTNVGDDKGVGATWASPSEETKVFGGASDDWSAGLSYSDINSSDFGIDIQVSWLTQDATAFIDYLTMTVYYTADGGGGGPVQSVTKRAKMECGGIIRRW